jgi:hypothetical protein
VCYMYCPMLPNDPPRSDFGPIHVIPLRIPLVYIVSSYQDTTTIIILCFTAQHDLVFIASTAIQRAIYKVNPYMMISIGVFEGTITAKTSALLYQVWYFSYTMRQPPSQFISLHLLSLAQSSPHIFSYVVARLTLKYIRKPLVESLMAHIFVALVLTPNLIGHKQKDRAIVFVVSSTTHLIMVSSLGIGLRQHTVQQSRAPTASH